MTAKDSTNRSTPIPDMEKQKNFHEFFFLERGGGVLIF